MLFYLLITVAVLIVIHFLMNHNAKATLISRMPGRKIKFLFGNALEIIRSPEDLFRWGRILAKEANGIYGLWIWPFAIVNIYNPQDIEKIISTTKFNEKSPVYKFLEPWLREGLLLSKGMKWHRRRKILTPAFHFNILKEFCIILEENSQRLVDRLKKTNGDSINVVPVISNYTLNSICETAMGTRLSERKGGAKLYKEAIYALGNICVERFVRIYLILDFVFNLTKLGKEQKNQLIILHNYTAAIIEERKDYLREHGFDVFSKSNENEVFAMNKKKKFAMLDLLILAEKEGEIDSQGVQEEVDTFMFEGHDTTASGLTYCLLLLANYKDIQDKVVAELHDIFGESDRLASIEDLSRMRYLECCIKESLRLYPPVHFISRWLDEEVELSNYKVPANTYCHIHIYDLHRREELFPDPLHFDPDRFSPENCIGRHPYAYIPFSAGPRNCIGQKFAMLELKSCLSAILRNFVLEPVTREEDLVFTSDLVLRNSGPVRVKFLPRNKSSTASY